jgi:shikimate kinase
MHMSAVILIGMMGVGKSTLGKELADQLGWEFKDTDKLLSYRLGRSIPQMFSIYGEDAFRQHETSILRGLEPGPFVLATGGGIVTREENWTELRRLGKVVFIDVPTDILVARLAISKKRRPLLETEDPESKVRELLEARRPLYEQADLRVVIEHEEIPEAAAKIREALA